MASRLLGMIIKEFIHLRRDALALFLALVMPVLMLFIFGWAINTDVKHIPTAVFEQSGSLEAQEFLEALVNTQYFDLRYRARSHKELTRLVDQGKAKIGVVIPPDFARRLSRQQGEVQVIVDASDPQVATSGINAAASLGAQRSLQIMTEAAAGTAGVRNPEPPLDVRVRAWYNPDLVSAIFIVPGLIGALLMQTTITAMAVSVVRERERGTLEALIVSPIRRWELLLGKIIPNLLVAYVQMTFLTFLPSIYLSGLLFPIEGMPWGAQYLASVIPLTYFLRIVRGIVLKGVGFSYLWPHLIPLLIFGAVIFSLAVFKFRKTLD